MKQNGNNNFHNYQQIQNTNPNTMQLNNQFANNNNPSTNINSQINTYKYNNNQLIQNNLPNITRQNNNLINQNIYSNNNMNNTQQTISNNRMPNISLPSNNLNYTTNNNNPSLINNNINNNILNGNNNLQLRPITGNNNLINLPDNTTQQTYLPGMPNNMSNMQNNNYNINLNNNNNINNLLYNNQNNNNNSIKNNTMSKSKEIKYKKQEEYRKILDEQMKQELERKERERQIKFGGGINGLGSLNNNINNMNNINNNILNGANTNNIIMDINNNTITKPSLNNEEKEKQRKKQMEYNQILRQQVEERNKRKELEKQKEKEEEMKLEEKLKLQLIENHKRAELMKNKDPKSNKYINNLESPENFMANPMSTMPIPQLNYQAQNSQFNNINQNYTTFHGFYANNNMNNLNNPNYITNYDNHTLSMNSTNKQSAIGGNTGLISNQNNNNNINNINNNNYPNNFFNITPSTNTNSNNLIQTQKSAMQYGPKQTPTQTMSVFSNSSKNNNNNFNNINSPYSEISPHNPRPSSQHQLRVRQPDWRIEELYMNFVQEQLKIINEYEININKYQNMKKDNFDTIKDLMNIKNKSLEKIQDAQNKFRNNVGVYPMDTNFNNRVTNLMDMILEKKINEIQRENRLEILANNFNKQRNSLRNNNDNNGGYNDYNNNNLQIIDNNKNTRNKNNNNDYIPMNESQINRNIIDCGYKSKYEELKLSMINGNEASQELRTSMSLAGFSKFVIQNKLAEHNQNQNMNENSNNNGSNINNNSNFENIYCNINNGQSNLYTTWNEEKFGDGEQNDFNNNINNSSLKNIENNTETKIRNKNNANINDNKNISNKDISQTTTMNRKKNNLEMTHFNRKLNNNRNTSKGILNDSQLPSRIVGNDKGYFNHANDDMSGTNISMQDSNSNINNYINGSELNIEQPSSIKQNSPSPKNPLIIETNNTMPTNINNDISPISKVPMSKINQNLQNKVKNLKITKEEKDKSLLLVGDNIIKNNLNNRGYSLREKENKEKSYLIGTLTTLNNNDNTLINNTNNTPNNTFIHINTINNLNIEKNKNNKNNNNNITGIDDNINGDYCKASQEDDNDNEDNDNDNVSIGVTINSKKNGIENNETEEDMVRGCGPSGMNSMLNDENNSNFNHSNINNNSGLSGVSGIVGHKFTKKKGIVNTNKEIQQIKEAEEKEEEENYACDFTLDKKTLKKLEEEEEKSQNMQKINLEDYKEIKESQKIQTQLNFFEDSATDNINVGKSKGRVVKSYNMYGNKKTNINNILNNNGNNINNSNSKKSNNTNNTNSKRPQSPKHNRNQKINSKTTIAKRDNTETNKNDIITNNNENSLFTSNNNLANDSYGDNIINDLDKYRKMFLEESSVSSINK